MTQVNLVSPLKPLEYEALRDSIRANGVTYPAIISDGPTKDRVIDGFHRLQICDELGMECPTQRKLYESVQDEDADALLLNAQRRQLDDLSGGLLNLKMMEIRGIPARGRKSPSGYTIEMLAAELGLSVTTFWRRVSLAKMMTRGDTDDIREAYEQDKLNTSEAIKLVKARDQLLKEGKSLSDPENELKALIRSIGSVQHGLPPTKAARLEGFTEGLKWAHEALTEDKAKGGWVEKHLDDFRESIGY